MHLDLMLLNFCRSNVSDEISLSARAGASNVSGEGRDICIILFLEKIFRKIKNVIVVTQKMKPAWL